MFIVNYVHVCTTCIRVSVCPRHVCVSIYTYIISSIIERDNVHLAMIITHTVLTTWYIIRSDHGGGRGDWQDWMRTEQLDLRRSLCFGLENYSMCAYLRIIVCDRTVGNARCAWWVPRVTRPNDIRRNKSYRIIYTRVLGFRYAFIKTPF